MVMIMMSNVYYINSLKQQSVGRHVFVLTPHRWMLRDQPFNLKGGDKSQNIFFFCRAKREFFFKSLILGYMTKTLNQIIFFPPPKYFF
jgi:hypothetical protein